MKPFLYRILLYLILFGVLVSLYIILIYFRPDLVDAFYYRFTTPKSHSLVIGGSRAAQGIKPEVINKLICSDENKIINHAFALGPSSIGPNYLRELTKKIDKSSDKGLFIISLVPWLLTIDSSEVDDSTRFYEVEKKLFVGNLKSSSSNPNFEYLTDHWVNKFEPFVRMFKYATGYEGISVLHADGWLEVTTDMDSIENQKRIKRSTEEYLTKKQKFSHIRFEYLEKIIRYCDTYGDVVIIRMPVTKGMAEIENTKFPEFDKMIQEIADKHGIPYFNYFGLSGQFLTVDTHHLYKKESERFTYLLCDSLQSYFSSHPSAFKLASASLN